MLKPKLPRKRKKALIKHEGLKKYRDTIELAKVTQESPCKFWKEVRNIPTFFNGCPVPIPTPLSYW